MRYEVKIWVIPPVLAEVTGRFDNVNDVLDHVKNIIKKGKYTLEDIEVRDNIKDKKVNVRVSEVNVHGKTKYL